MANVQVIWPEKGSNIAKLFDWVFQTKYEDYTSSQQQFGYNPWG